MSVPRLDGRIVIALACLQKVEGFLPCVLRLDPGAFLLFVVCLEALCLLFLFFISFFKDVLHIHLFLSSEHRQFHIKGLVAIPDMIDPTIYETLVN